VADNRVERPSRLDELEQPVALPFEQPLLERPEHRGVETLAAFAGRLHQHVEIGQRDAGRELGELGDREVGEIDHRRVAGRRGDERGALRLGRQRHLDRGDVRVVGEPIVDVGELLVDQHEGHVQPLDVRAHRPVDHRDQLRGRLQVETAGFARREQVRRLVDDHGDADAVGLGRHDVVADEPVEHREGGRRILRRRAQVGDFLRRERDHVAQPLFVAACEHAEAAAQIVVEHERPAAEQLLGQKLGDDAVA
jgi:hypothetical protein